MKRFAWISVAIAALSCIAAGAFPALAQTFPDRPIHIIVPYTPGGPSDIMARLYGAGLSQAWGQPVVIDNRPGAAGIVGHGMVAKSAPDGYTLIVSNFSDVLNTSLGAKLPYDFAKDFQPISGLSATPFILVVNPSLPIHSLDELIAYAKANPDKLSYASSGIGTGSHLAAELLKMRAGIKMLHVPYPGVAPASVDVMAGYVSLMFMNASTAAEPIKAGQVRALGVSTLRRTSVAPDVPTLAELGLAGFDVQTWNGVQAPAGTPMAIIDKLAEEARRIVTDPALGPKLKALGSDAIPSSPTEFKTYIKSEIDKWTDVAKAANIHPPEP